MITKKMLGVILEAVKATDFTVSDKWTQLPCGDVLIANRAGYVARLSGQKPGESFEIMEWDIRDTLMVWMDPENLNAIAEFFLEMKELRL